jgi:hypothetical protein
MISFKGKLPQEDHNLAGNLQRLSLRPRIIQFLSKYLNKKSRDPAPLRLRGNMQDGI